MFLTMTVAAGERAGTAAFTTAHLILIAVLAVVVVLGILWGARQKRTRNAAEREEAQQAEVLIDHPNAAPPVAPAPPPADETGLGAAAPAATQSQTRTAAAAPTKQTAPRASASKAEAAESAPVKPTPKARAAAAPASETAQPKPAARTAAKAATAKPADPTGYQLLDVKGLGPKAVPLLAGLGIGDLQALAGLNAARATEIDGQLGVLSGRMARDKWVDQAKLLVKGKKDEFEAKYGKL